MQSCYTISHLVERATIEAMETRAPYTVVAFGDDGSMIACINGALWKAL